MRRFALCCTIAAVIIVGNANADESRPVTLRALFPKEAEVTVEQPGVARLPLPPEVLGAAGRQSRARLVSAPVVFRKSPGGYVGGRGRVLSGAELRAERRPIARDREAARRSARRGRAPKRGRAYDRRALSPAGPRAGP